MRRPRFFIILAILLAVNAGFIAYRMGFLDPGYLRNLGRVGEVMRLVESYYVGGQGKAAGYDEMARSALREIVNNLDEHSRYWSEEDFENFKMDTGQQYVGIGVRIEQLNGRITIVEVFEGSAAGKAGLENGDQIIEVAGEDMRQASLQDIVTRLRGPAGTATEVTIRRPDSGETFSRSVRRAPVDLPSVTGVALREDGIATVTITQFGTRTGEEFADTLAGLEARGMRGLIIDLRDNPGGLLTSAVEVAGQFFPANALILETRGRLVDREYRNPLNPPGRDYPIAIIINGRSASASEILAGSLQDTERAIIVGSQSVGKGSVQSVIELGNGEAVKLTTARYFLPSGRTIEDVGITPDVKVPLALDERQKLMFQTSHQRQLTDAQFERRFGFQPIEDRQLKAAIDILRGALIFDGNSPAQAQRPAA